MKCPDCGSETIVKQGTYRRRTPVYTELPQYKCKKCLHVFHDDSKPINIAPPTMEVAGNPDPPPLSENAQVNTPKQNTSPLSAEPPNNTQQ
jgi:hypothetical protein